MSGFSTSGTQIISPNGQPFVAKGVATFSWPTLTNPSAINTLLSQFPGINMIRLAANSGLTDNPPYNNTPDTVASLTNFINEVTAKGIVVEIEDHTAWQDPDTLSGSALSNEVAWYASFADAFKNNPYVWFGTMNEPLNSANPSAIQAQELATYNGIRATGNTAPVLMELSGGTGASFAQPSAYAPLTNVVWDFHSYGMDTPGISTNQAAVTATLNSYVASAQAVKAAPVIIGEYGPATGSGVDANAAQLENAVWNSGLGSIAWTWGGGGPDAMGGPGGLNYWGQQVAEFIGTASPPPPPPPPTGDDTLVLNLSADLYQGAPKFIVSVDGQQQGGAQSVTGVHSAGQTQAFDFTGMFGLGQHDVAISFINDAWGGTPQTDRNLYVNSIDYNGHHYGSDSAVLASNGTVHFTVGTP